MNAIFVMLDLAVAGGAVLVAGRTGVGVNAASLVVGAGSSGVEVNTGTLVFCEAGAAVRAVCVRRSVKGSVVAVGLAVTRLVGVSTMRVGSDVAQCVSVSRTTSSISLPTEPMMGFMLWSANDSAVAGLHWREAEKNARMTQSATRYASAPVAQAAPEIGSASE